MSPLRDFLVAPRTGEAVVDDRARRMRRRARPRRSPRPRHRRWACWPPAKPPTAPRRRRASGWRSRGAAPAALVCVHAPGAVTTMPTLRAPARAGAARLAGSLRARGLEASARGRLRARAPARRSRAARGRGGARLAAAGPLPIVLAAAARDEDVDALLGVPRRDPRRAARRRRARARGPGPRGGGGARPSRGGALLRAGSRPARAGARRRARAARDLPRRGGDGRVSARRCERRALGCGAVLRAWWALRASESGQAAMVLLGLLVAVRPRRDRPRWDRTRRRRPRRPAERPPTSRRWRPLARCAMPTRGSSSRPARGRPNPRHLDARHTWRWAAAAARPPGATAPRDARVRFPPARARAGACRASTCAMRSRVGRRRGRASRRSREAELAPPR